MRSEKSRHRLRGRRDFPFLDFSGRLFRFALRLRPRRSSTLDSHDGHARPIGRLLTASDLAASRAIARSTTNLASSSGGRSILASAGGLSVAVGVAQAPI